MSDLVSIITPSFQSERFIEEAMLSAISQTYQNWEMIIVDDLSTDGSIDIISNYCEKDKRIKLVRSEENVGPAAARNKGIKLAKGRYIAFLDSDDIWLSNKLEVQVSFMEENNLPFTFSSYYTMTENGQKKNCRKAPPKLTYTDLLKTNSIGNLTTIYDASRIGKKYFKDVKHEDYCLWLDMIKDLGVVYGVTTPLANYRVLSSSISSNKLKTISWQWSIYRNIEKLNFFSAAYYLFWYAVYALLKRSPNMDCR